MPVDKYGFVAGQSSTVFQVLSGSMDPEKAHDRFHDRVNMTVDELEAWEDSENYDIYEDRKSGGQPIDEPREDVIRLLETPEDEWEDKDDGFNEVEEANEAVGFIDRMSEVEQGDPMPGTDPILSKRDGSLLNWGRDPNPDKKDFDGDLQL